MAAHQRFHLDQDGHSITVLCDLPRHHVEVLVDGKAVSSVRTGRAAVTLVRGEITTEPPRPFTVRLEHPDDPGGIPLCVLETERMRYLMPNVPQTRQEEWPAEPTPSPRTPGELLARWRARYRDRRPPGGSAAH
ncbi:hypothetical protein [Streptomyces sp. NPDC002044]|uniref:hypothetical protein n=1 Tax=Streptomyces sp. NPDC002044 TaxID=3154662 RepID=UPI003326B956